MKKQVDASSYTISRGTTIKFPEPAEIACLLGLAKRISYATHCPKRIGTTIL